MACLKNSWTVAAVLTFVTSAAHAVAPGGCTCIPPHCGPDDNPRPVPRDEFMGSVGSHDYTKPSFILAAEGIYITDENGDVWYCVEDVCTWTGITKST